MAGTLEPARIGPVIGTTVALLTLTACSADERPVQGTAAVLLVSGDGGTEPPPDQAQPPALPEAPSPSPRPGGPRAFDPPAAQAVPVVRTDFSDDAVWTAIQRELLAPSALSDYAPALHSHDRPAWAGLGPASLDRRIPRSFPIAYDQPFLVVVDRLAITGPEHPVLLVDLSEEGTAPSFRALPREVADIEANLPIANLDFRDFQGAADADGVFRGPS